MENKKKYENNYVLYLVEYFSEYKRIEKKKAFKFHLPCDVYNIVYQFFIYRTNKRLEKKLVIKAFIIYIKNKSYNRKYILN